MDPHSRSPKKNTSHGNEVLPRDTTHLKQRPCYQRESPCQDPADNWTTRRPPDDRKETQTAVVWSCLPFIRSGQNHLARHSERGKKTKRTKEEVGREHQGMDRLGVRQAPEGSGERGKMEKTGCKIICGAPTTLAVKGLMMMIIECSDCTVFYLWYIILKGRLRMYDAYLPVWNLRLSYDSTLLSPVLFSCRVLLLFLSCLFCAYWPILLTFFPSKF